MATVAKHVPGTTGYAHIVKRPGYCFGKAAIDETRVRVHNVICLLKMGLTPERMREEWYPQLSLSQVHGALVYYYDHVEEIEVELKAQEATPEELRAARVLPLPPER